MSGSSEHLELENNVRLIMQYQTILVRHIETSLNNGQVDEHTAARLKSQGCIYLTRDEILDHFEGIFRELVTYYQDRLRERIVKGAEFIDSLAPDDPRRMPAMEKYDGLCMQLKESEGRT
ncbi:hypothetical protein QP794_02690 [Paenibacillus sp. UMB7766-LJ446]|uniref:hypothetical protein n=1 Tax=Paenibacillus sp. UMB7766-LJ446 TaxID=3046313 RepID=UPI00254F2892|nr:hypothetical protein [Paenibacillus sp. UMB7766-LJ446]MDK8188993.1 hypothetical protein [Paenibacillus sp. UMB7766-LJ446]